VKPFDPHALRTPLVQLPVPPDPDTLRAVADDTGAQFFATANSKVFRKMMLVAPSGIKPAEG